MSGTDKNTGVGPLSPSVHRQFEEEDIGGEGGTASRNGLQKTLPKPRSLALSSSGKLESLPMLLITANVGSMFDDPQHLIPQWLSQVCKQIQAQKPAFVAIHCQEVNTIQYRLAIVIILTSFFRLGARTLNKVWRMSTSSWVNCELVYPSWALEERWPFSMKTLPPPKSMSQSFLLVLFFF